MNIVWGVAEDIGLRESLEDTYAISDFPGDDSFGAEVFDGHGGKEAARYAAEMMMPAFWHLLAERSRGPKTGEERDAGLIRRAFSDVDRYITERRTDSGTTAALIYFFPDRFLAANAGDTRIVVGTGQGALTLTEDHKPNLPGERSRIEALGGHVLNRYGTWRVEGVLAVSRSLGDRRLKPFVTPEPRVVEGRLGKENDYVVLACDGVWDVLTDLNVMALVRQAKRPDEAAALVLREAIRQGSTDNITVIVLDVRPLAATAERRAIEVLSVVDFAGPVST
jgi:serine/threonine protein phosphatase PrpC